MRMNGDNYQPLQLLAQNINAELQPFVSAKNHIEGIMEDIKSDVCNQTNRAFLDKYYIDEKLLIDNIEFLAKSYIHMLTVVADELEFDARRREHWSPQDIGY